MNTVDYTGDEVVGMSAVSGEAAEQQAAVSPTKAQLATVNADPKWERRRRVIEALEEYKRRLDSRASLHDRYEVLCSRLYSSRSSRITGMPANHDQFAAGDRFAEMLDEKMNMEKALAAEELDEMELALKFLDSRSRIFLKRFYLDTDRQNAHSLLMEELGLSSTHIYRERDESLDKLYNILYAEV